MDVWTNLSTFGKGRLMVSAIGDMFSRSLKTFLRPVLALWEDPQVMELVIHGSSEVWVDRGCSLEKVDEVFPSDQLGQAIRQIGQLVGVLINEENPHLSKQLPDGTELSIAVPPLAKAGPILAIRKGNYEQPSLDEMIQGGFLTSAVADFVKLSLLAQQSVLVVGPTGSGVQTLFQALVRSLPTSERLVRLERESPAPLEHPHLMSFSLNAENGVRTPLQSLLSTVMMLRPHRVVVEHLGHEDVATLLPWLAGGYPGSLATLRAFDVEHAMQVLQMWGLRESPELSVPAIRSQVVSAFPLVIVCRRLPNGMAQVDAVSELLPLSEKGSCRVLPLFRRRFLERSRNPDVDDISDSPTGVLLPAGHIPSFWSHIRHLRGGYLDRAFFHPANYDGEGNRLENKAIPAMAPVGVPMEEAEERDTRSRPVVEREVPAAPPAPPAPEKSKKKKEPAPSSASVLESKIRDRLLKQALTESTEESDEEAEATFLQHASPEPPSEPPEPSAAFEDMGEDVPTEPGQSLKELMDEAEESPAPVAPAMPPAFSAPPLEDVKTLVHHTESPEKSVGDPFDKVPTRVASQQITKQREPNVAIPGVEASLPSAVPQQVILGGKGLMDSQEISSALTVSRTTSPRDNNEAVSTAPHVPVDAELIAAGKDMDISVDTAHPLDISDMVVEEENASVVSEADLRWVEQELREQAPLRPRNEKPHLATEVVPREMMTPPHRPALPDNDLHTDPENTFRHGQRSPLIGPDQPQVHTVPETPSIEDDSDQTYIPQRQQSPSVMVRRGSRQVVSPSNPSIETYTADVSSASTSIRGRSPLADPAFVAGQKERKGPPPLPSQGSLPASPASNAPRPAVPPPLPNNRAQGIRPPSSPPPAMLSIQNSDADEGSNEATLIRGRRPPTFKK